MLDCVERGMRMSEAGYGVIEDPVSPLSGRVNRAETREQSQATLFEAFGVKPKLELEVKAEGVTRLKARVRATA